MRFSFIIPCHNSESTIAHCLESILSQSKLFAKDEVEIIVVDNASTDSTYQKVVNSGITPIKVEEKSNSKARNRGAEIAQGEFFVFC